MKRIAMMGLMCGVASALAGCQEEKLEHSSGTFAIGVQEVSEPDSTQTLAKDYADYRRLLGSEDYEGVSFFRVTKPGFDVTDTSDDGAEQILRVENSKDFEEFSTRETLQTLSTEVIYGSQSPPGIAGAPADEPPTATTVTLGFPALLSAEAIPGNGVVEVDPNSDDTLSVEWQSTQDNDLLTASMTLESEE